MSGWPTECTFLKGPIGGKVISEAFSKVSASSSADFTWEDSEHLCLVTIG